MGKKCCFIGHRKVEKSEELLSRLDECLQKLIDDGVRIFLFGSRSEFDTLCYRQVTKLKEKYPDIKRIAYTCKSEYACKSEEKESLEQALMSTTKRNESLKDYEGAVRAKRLERAGKASYVERNEDMINASEYGVFYYNPNYLPPKRKQSKSLVSEYQPPSGTSIAYEFAYQRKRIVKKLEIINLYDENGLPKVWWGKKRNNN